MLVCHLVIIIIVVQRVIVTPSIVIVAFSIIVIRVVTVCSTHDEASVCPMRGLGAAPEDWSAQSDQGRRQPAWPSA